MRNAQIVHYGTADHRLRDRQIMSPKSCLNHPYRPDPPQSPGLDRAGQALHCQLVPARTNTATDSPGRIRTATQTATQVEPLALVDVVLPAMPSKPDPGPGADEEKLLDFQASREVRHTVIRVITAHLQDGAAISWQGLNSDFMVPTSMAVASHKPDSPAVQFASTKPSSPVVRFDSTMPSSLVAQSTSILLVSHAAKSSLTTPSFPAAESALTLLPSAVAMSASLVPNSRAAT